MATKLYLIWLEQENIEMNEDNQKFIDRMSNEDGDILAEDADRLLEIIGDQIQEIKKLNDISSNHIEKIKRCDQQSYIEMGLLKVQIDYLKKQLLDAQYWRERHCNDSLANGLQSQQNWYKAQATEQELKVVKEQLKESEGQLDFVFERMGLHETGALETRGTAIVECWSSDMKSLKEANDEIKQLKAELDIHKGFHRSF